MPGPTAALELLRLLDDERAQVRFAAAKRLQGLSLTNPRAIEPVADEVAALLDGPNRILQWNAVRILGNLAAIEPRQRVVARLPLFRALMRRGELVLTNNTVEAMAQVARHHRALQAQVCRELLLVEGYRHKTPECKRITMGKVAAAMSTFEPRAVRTPAVRAFAARHIRSRRASTRRKAAALLARMDAGTAGRAATSPRGRKARPAVARGRPRA